MAPNGSAEPNSGDGRRRRTDWERGNLSLCTRGGGLAAPPRSARACRHHPGMSRPHPGWSGSLLGSGRDRCCRHSRHLSRANRDARQERTELRAPRGQGLRGIGLRIGIGPHHPATRGLRPHTPRVSLRSRCRRQGCGRRPAHARQCDASSHRSVLSLSGAPAKTGGPRALVDLVVEIATAWARRRRAMKPVAFDYYRPEAVSEALALLSEMGHEAAVLAGGMTLGPMLNLRMIRPRAVIDISRIPALKTVSARSNIVVTGAGVVQGDALRSDLIAGEVPLLVMALPWVGHFQTRNRGTLGGSVAHADPSAEIPLALVVCGGTVVLQSRRRGRRVPAREVFLGGVATQRRADEMVTALEWPRVAPDAGHAFMEIAQRHGDFAIAAAGCSLRLDGVDRLEQLSLGVGGVESQPVAI